MKRAVFFLIFFLLQPLYARDNATLSKGQKVLLTNAAIGATIAVWGVTQWEYGTESLHMGSEGWFGRETSNGGSDKLGHFYTNYVITRLLTPLYEKWGYDNAWASGYAALTSVFASVVVMEVGDATSPEHGFSNEDFIADMVGSLVGYYWARYPAVAEKIDFRVEYLPDFSQKIQSDFTTDYEHMKHLMALKFSGFEALRNTPLQYFELHAGYYSRNFDHDSLPIEGRERYVYGAIGINLSHLLEPLAGGYSQIFNYFQVPFTYVPYDHNLDEE